MIDLSIPHALSSVRQCERVWAMERDRDHLRYEEFVIKTELQNHQVLMVLLEQGEKKREGMKEGKSLFEEKGRRTMEPLQSLNFLLR